MVRPVARHRWRILLGTVLMAGVFFVRAHTQPEVYAATARVTVVPGQVAAGQADAGATRRMTLAVADLVTSEDVAGRAADDVEAESAATVRARIDARAVPDSGAVVITARGGTATDAAVLAQAVAERLVDAVVADQEAARAEARVRADREIEAIARRIDSPLLTEAERAALDERRQVLIEKAAEDQLRPVDRARVTAPGRAGRTPVSPRPWRDAGVAAGLALLFNAALAIVADKASGRFSAHAVDDVGTLAGLPVLATIPGGDDAVEGIRTLRTALMFVSTPERLRTLAIVGAERAVGRSFIAEHLAREAAALDVTVVLVDGDVRNPVLHTRFGVERTPGLVDALSHRATLDDVAVDVGSSVRFVPAGEEADDASGLLGAGPLGDLLEKFTWAELVVVDTPPALSTGDALSIAAQCDATLVVVDIDVSRRRTVRRLVDALRPSDAHLIGVVVNLRQ
jgi:Mrp family chromosome partitioning ATPase